MRKRVSKRKKQVLLGTSILLVGLILLVLLGIWLFQDKKVIYSSKSRTEEIKQAKNDFENSITGWIRVQGTNIDYPIILDDGSTDLGTITDDFAWVNKTYEQGDNRAVIFGHNILNVSKQPLITDKNHNRFEQLMSFAYYDFVKDNKYIEVVQNGQTSLYAIYGVSFEIEDFDLYYKYKYSTKEMKEYINQVKENSYFDFSLDVSENDDMISLVTCTRFFGANSDMYFKIDARKLRDNEKAVNYGVKEKSNYKEIKEIMEGDEGDEEA